MLTLPYNSKITQEEFLEHSGYNLASRLTLDDKSSDASEVADRFLLEAARQVYECISEYTNSKKAQDLFASNDENVISKLALAQYYQAVYLFENGDFRSDATNENRKFYSPSMLLAINDYIYIGI